MSVELTSSKSQRIRKPEPTSATFPSEPNKWTRRSRWALTLVLLAAAVFWFRSQFALVIVVGESMEPLYHTGDLLLVERGIFKGREPCPGDLVVVRHHGELMVKRVVGVPGEVVEIRAGALYINEERRAEPYVKKSGELNIAPGKLRTGKFALAGDNRAVGSSQFIHAVVSKQEIVGGVKFFLPLPRRVR
jgi:signal peptidase I